MQIELVAELPPSGGHENIVTAKDVFFPYLFAYPTSNQDAKTLAKIIKNIVTKHAYLPTTPISDKSTAFMPHVNKEIGGVFGITLKHATTSTLKQLGCLSDLTPQLRKHSRSRQANEDHCGTKTSPLRSLITTLLITQVLAVSQAEFFTSASQNYLRFKIGNSPAASTHIYLENCPRCS